MFEGGKKVILWPIDFDFHIRLNLSPFCWVGNELRVRNSLEAHHDCDVACSFPMICNQAISLAWVKLFQLNQEGQYSGIFESLAVIGWLSKDLYPVSLYMNKERGEAEDFCNLCDAVHDHHLTSS